MQTRFLSRRRSSMFIVFALLLGGCTGEQAQGQQARGLAQGEQTQEDPLRVPDDVDRQFDFWLGEWNVQNNHLDGGGQWQETGQARALIQSVAGGNAVLEQWEGTARSPLHGFSIRMFDEQLEKWVIVLNWHGGQPSGFSQMHGVFGEDRGEFFPPGDGPKGVRFTFSKARPSSCQWDQAVSSDGGETWTTNWIMSFTRREEPKTADASSIEIKTPPDSAKSFTTSRELDSLIGKWSGTASRVKADGTREEGTVEVATTSMIEGLGLLHFADYSWGGNSMNALAFDPNRRKWVSVGVDDNSPQFEWLNGAVRNDAIVWLDMRIGGTTIVKESWTGLSGDALNIEREISEDGGRTWNPVLTAELQRERD